MIIEDIITIGCDLRSDGTVVPRPGFEGNFMSDGPFHGNCRFDYLPARGTEPASIRARRAAAVPGKEEVVSGPAFTEEAWSGILLLQIDVYDTLNESPGALWANAKAFVTPSVGSFMHLAEWPMAGFTIIKDGAPVTHSDCPHPSFGSPSDQYWICSGGSSTIPPDPADVLGQLAFDDDYYNPGVIIQIESFDDPVWTATFGDHSTGIPGYPQSPFGVTIDLSWVYFLRAATGTKYTLNP